MKSRGVYETPGGTILYEAHQQLEELILDRDTYAVKKDMGNKLAQIVYEGKWFTPLREAVQAFIESTQKYVTGEVTSSRPERLLRTLSTMRVLHPLQQAIFMTITMQKASSTSLVFLPRYVP